MSWEAVHNAISLPPARCAKAEWIFIAFRHFHHFRGPHTKIVVLPLTAVCHLDVTNLDGRPFQIV